MRMLIILFCTVQSFTPAVWAQADLLKSPGLSNAVEKIPAPDFLPERFVHQLSGEQLKESLEGQAQGKDHYLLTYTTANDNSLSVSRYKNSKGVEFVQEQTRGEQKTVTRCSYKSAISTGNFERHSKETAIQKFRRHLSCDDFDLKYIDHHQTGGVLRETFEKKDGKYVKMGQEKLPYHSHH